MDKYLSRSIDQALLEWKDNPRRKPLLVRVFTGNQRIEKLTANCQANVSVGF